MDFTEIIELEKKLLDPLVRKDTNSLNELLDDSFVEFGTSGEVYDKKTVMELLSKENLGSVEAVDFLLVQLSPDIVQLRFKTQKKNQDGSVVSSLRSSIWKKVGKKWAMVFHQGTPRGLR